ncbi:MAG: DUF2490 domain-containing protein [Bacteroidota bacterium]|jgi:hypothetical protein
MKKYILNILIISALVLTISSKSLAQTHSTNDDIWLHYYGKNMLTKKLSFTFEGVLRFANGFSEKQQYFVRPSIDYQLTKHLVGSLGYSHYLTYVYGDPAINKIPVPENHIWLQTQFTHQFGDLKITNRLRDENRYVGVAIKDAAGTYNIDHYAYRNRFRYMLLLNYPLIKDEKKATKLFGILGDEVFLNIGSIASSPNAESNVGATLLNQNRIIAGFGYNINAHHQIQLSYIHQNVWNFPDTIEESNPTVRLSYYTNFSFAQK